MRCQTQQGTSETGFWHRHETFSSQAAAPLEIQVEGSSWHSGKVLSDMDFNKFVKRSLRTKRVKTDVLLLLGEETETQSWLVSRYLPELESVFLLRVPEALWRTPKPAAADLLNAHKKLSPKNLSLICRSEAVLGSAAL